MWGTLIYGYGAGYAPWRHQWFPHTAILLRFDQDLDFELARDWDCAMAMICTGHGDEPFDAPVMSRAFREHLPIYVHAEEVADLFQYLKQLPYWIHGYRVIFLNWDGEVLSK